ncbi:uncharacterized protein LOC126667839 [Mercurialis annua]|uniref:uncharacterized protein LOC126667839 n=1 Tax=Mercurialis annua TaxID=3986 RepID=UPI0021603AC8|nr:uncharacterized protein LOC126667839 [Mercurialis annua]
MLLRSSSTPVLKSYGRQLPPEADHHGHGYGFSPTRHHVSMPLQRTVSESELKLCSFLGNGDKEKILPGSCVRSAVIVREKEEMNVCMKTASSLLSDNEVVVSDGGGFGGGGVSGGGGGNGGGSWDFGNEQMDIYYQGMIETYPGDSLLLANYAKFLKEVRGDIVKAEKICERAIVTNRNDGNVLSMYGDLIWNNHKNSDRAQTYFDQAVRSSPDDCHVMASYAKFLWEVPDEEDEEENQKNELPFSKYSTPYNLSQEHTHFAAAS